MPRSAVHQTVLDVAGAPFALLAIPVIFLPSYFERILVPMYTVWRGKGGGKNVSQTSGSATAKYVMQARALYQAIGIGPDFLARRLLLCKFSFSSKVSRVAFLLSFYTAVWYFKLFKRDLMAAIEKLFANIADYKDSKENGGKMIAASINTYLHVRTCYFDDVVETFIKEDRSSLSTVQVVVLGAGYDTRCYRLAQSNGDTKHDASISKVVWYEADAPGTQKVKRAALKETGVSTSYVKYVSVDFNVPNGWVGALAEAGLDFSKKTLFIWEGVTMYLSPASVEKTLRGVSEHFARGSKICFDYLCSEIVFRKRTQAITKSIGEPYLFGLPAPGMRPSNEADVHVRRLVESQGLQLVEHFWDLEEAKKRYLPLYPDGSIVGFAEQGHYPGCCVAAV